MKKLTLLLSTIFILGSLNTADAQIWKRIKDKAERKLEKKAEEKIDEAINKKKKKKEAEERDESPENETEVENKSPEESETSETDNTPQVWRNFKFIPGEKVIFYDDLKFEEVGEFPSRWDLVKGGSEIAQVNNEKVIILTSNTSNIINPLFDSENYLGDEFTIEYDILIPKLEKNGIWYIKNNIHFDNNANTSKDVSMEAYTSSKKITGYAGKSDFRIESPSLGEQNAWHHISISYYKGKYKMYYDDKRIINIPKFPRKPEVFWLDVSCYAHKDAKIKYMAIKNIRIAHGGGQMYKRIMADGKYTTNGILFNSGKATIKPQSMGIINKLVTVMNENPDWKFQIIGHTDSDGTDESNLTLSQQRAEAVKQAIVNQGVAKDRLTILGKGESEPLNTNSSIEEKANNRRVEFIKS